MRFPRSCFGSVEIDFARVDGWLSNPCGGSFGVVGGRAFSYPQMTQMKESQRISLRIGE
jgi:hypothetical protein